MKTLINHPRLRGKSFTSIITDEIDNRPYTVLEDHWDYPGRKRVDANGTIARWIAEQDPTQWHRDSVVEPPRWYRFVITPELLTLLQLKF